jgi:hypothetical protein
MKRSVLKAAVSALAILILAAGCSQSPTSPAPDGGNGGIFTENYG